MRKIHTPEALKAAENIKYQRREILGFTNPLPLIEIYNEVLSSILTEDERMSKRKWYAMEKFGIIPDDPTRRKVLARLLDLPATAMGLVVLSQESDKTSLHSFLHENIFTTERGSVDEKSIQKLLSNIWKKHYGIRNQIMLMQQIQTLQHSYIYKYGRERERIAELLCECLILLSMFHTNRKNDAALALPDPNIILDLAYDLAVNHHFEYIAAKTISIRNIHNIRAWKATPKRMYHKEMLEKVLLDIQKEYHHLNQIKNQDTKQLYAALVGDEANIKAALASDGKSKQEVFVKIKEVEKLLSKTSGTDPFLPNIESEWGIIDNASSLIYLKETKEAFSLLSQLKRGGKKEYSRYITADTEEAEGHTIAGHIEVSMEMCIDLLPRITKVGGGRHLLRVENLYTELREQPKYKSAESVIRLGGHLEYVKSVLSL